MVRGFEKRIENQACVTLAFGRWMRLLWVWWWVCLVGLLGLWFSSLHGQALAILNARRTLVLSEMSSMDERLTALRRFNETVLRSCKTRALAGPTLSFNLEQLREHAQPFANLYYCKAGRWQEPKPPEWLQTRVEQESPQFGTEIIELRPLAPGLASTITGWPRAMPSFIAKLFLITTA